MIYTELMDYRIEKKEVEEQESQCVVPMSIAWFFGTVYTVPWYLWFVEFW